MNEQKQAELKIEKAALEEEKRREVEKAEKAKQIQMAAAEVQLKAEKYKR